MRTSLCFVSALAVLGACATGPGAGESPASAAPAPAVAATLAAAQSLVAEGKPREALAELDLVHAANAKLREAWVLRARACLAAAATDTQPQFYYEDAIAAIERAQALRRDPALDFDAARAARMLQRVDRAQDFVERAERDVSAPTPEQQQVAIQVAFDRYIQAKQAGESNASELASALEARLMARATALVKDAWAYEQLANLFLWEGRPDLAADALGDLVRARPDDEAAHVRFVQQMRAAEGSESVVAFYERLRDELPDSALCAWFEASELFEQGLVELAARRDAIARFVRAEELFLACRELEPRHEQACLGYEVMCRAGVGWSYYHAGDDAAAEQAFVATEDVLPGGAQWRLEGRLGSGVEGLMYLADRAFRGAQHELDYDAAGKAARLYAKLRELKPDDAELANNAGFFHREWGVPMLMHARELRKAAAAEQDAAERAQLEARAAGLEAQGRVVIAACCDAYKACADLAPDNVRWVNSYALMLVYHYPSRLDEAEKLLQHCVAQGEQQSQDLARSAEERDLIAEGWGDANQNLGMIELVHRKDPVRALMYFQRSFDIGPRPRIDRRWVEEVAMHWCREVADGKPLDLEQLDPRVYLLE